MTIIFHSNECWKIEKINLDFNLYCYAFTCPCLFRVSFTDDLYNSAVLPQKFINFDKLLSKKSLWAIFRSDIYYEAILLSEEVNSNEKEKINKYIDILNADRLSMNIRYIHNFSRIFDSKTNEPLPRSLPPLLLNYLGDVNSANSKCIYLASIYNTLLENTSLHNNMIIQPTFLQNMKINYIVPKIPKLNITSKKIYFFIAVFVIILLYIFISYKLKYYNNITKNFNYNNFTKNITSIFYLSIIIFIFYHLYRFFIVKYLIYKSAEIITEFNKPHMDCHMSCKKMFQNNLSYEFNNQLFTLKDNNTNKLYLSDFQNNSYKNENKNVTVLSNAIEKLRNNCNFNCGNNTVLLVLNIFNNDAFEDISFSTTSLLDSILHIYFISKQTEHDKKEYYENIIRYFDICVF